jgi:ABC-2 type transport system permease protein
MIGRTLAVMRKEFIHIIRDPRTLVVIFLIPIVQLVLLGYAATTDIAHLSTAVLDGDRTLQSRALVDAYRATGYFNISHVVRSEAELARLVDDGTVRAGLVIPAGYGRDMAAGRRTQVGFVIDGSDPSVSTTVFAASQSVGQAQTQNIIRRRLGLVAGSLPGVEVRPRVWYNPEMKSANFMIPALMGMILQTLATILTAMAIVREREQGTMEQLIVTPIRPAELVVGKMLPYVLVAFFDLTEVLLIGYFWFGVPIHGSLLLLLILSTLFLVTSLGIGLFISSISYTQQEAMMMTWFLMLPSIFLSGFFFPLEAMPRALQAASYVIPLRYLLIILRGIILKGVGLRSLAGETWALAIFGVVIMSMASLRFRKELE